MGKYEKRINEKSIPMADEILSLVNNLPAAGGGEDLQSTVAEQTAAVTALLAMVNRKVAENNGEGQYVWNKLTAEGGDFIDFVVSSDAEAYPNGGEQDGYWYELVEEGLNIAELFGFTEMAIDTFTLSADKTLSESPRAHSLGKQPKAVLIFSDIYSLPTTTTTYLKFAFGIAPSRIVSPVDSSSGIQGFNLYHRVSTSSGNRMACENDSMVNALTTGYVKFKEKSETLSPTIYFQSGVEYTMLTFA